MLLNMNPFIFITVVTLVKKILLRMRVLVILIYSILRCVLAASVTDSATISFKKIARKCFLSNLNKKFTGKPVELNQPMDFREEEGKLDSFREARIDYPLMKHIFEYLGKEELDNMKNLSTKFRSLVALSMADKLRKLSPYFVFRVNWLNDFFYTFLNEANLTEYLLTEDDLEVINYKMCLRFENYEPTLLDDLKTLLISFLNEFIYGVNQTIPKNIIEWRFNFAKRLSKYSYTTAFEIYKLGASDKSLKFIGKLYERITPEELGRLFDWSNPFSYYVADLNYMDPDVASAFIELGCCFLQNDSDRIKATEAMFKTNSFSQPFWDYIQNYPHVLKNIHFGRLGTCGPRWDRERAIKSAPAEGVEGPLYLITRSSADPFDMEVFKQFNLPPGMFTAFLDMFLAVSEPNLIGLEIMNELHDHCMVPAYILKMIDCEFD